ncbi:MAG: NAD-dependent malic enzyme [Candidatus Marinimicrobia bacterium]|jgi:malate dehydrogenase (oxaloacetate-decarboxylating)(NADP+)|nr:NAD-dependent malic enzyme [Candidatus Neomarinimicrobiota bacterium]MBT3618242.1 NAD-dependent malic enzyme [Candidatus Neomarinimicrobiota bacterium]MBT3829568.1 NAD-dependent malic enzyme [Candidatus Neomarinimicrobiota bacterium]MBT3997451.1 NAD-dependent malic enzyme [Candidatus Neomarinimicrobiota bacterium]MBT4281641.1 NAD-dependent malic enzyme [Candidatus Neomarinimicrobiota bacterium]
MTEFKKMISELHGGSHILHEPLLNKGTAFTQKERDTFGLHGLLPPRVTTIEEQKNRILMNFNSKSNDIEKYLYLMGLHDRNETLFYRIVIDEIETMMPVIYTPTVGEACQKFGYLFRRPRGLYISYRDHNNIKNVLLNWQNKEVDVIVVTDGERILGLGDQGANGMGIPIGKLSLYTACAGIDPSKTLPIMLDVGTNNSDLLNDPNYLGVKQNRICGRKYDDFLDEFMDAVKTVFPDTLIQFEDFANRNASRLLCKYQNNFRMMNDDIQGTAAIGVAGLLGSEKLTGRKLKDEKLLFYGAGSAGIGIGELYSKALSKNGIPIEQARERCWFIDSRGLVVNGRENVSEDKKPFAHPFEHLSDLTEIIRAVKPTALIGVSGQAQAFTKNAIRTLADIHDNPVIFALSNPTSKSECTAEQAYQWTNGKCVFASGSPFDPVEINGETHVPGQGNNAYVFPGVGLGVVASKADRVTDEMFLIASEIISKSLSPNDLDHGRVFPPLTQIRDLSLEIATTIAEFETDENKIDFIREMMYKAEYQDYI